MHVKRTGHFKIRVTCEGIKLINKEIILQADFSGVPSSFAFFLRLMLRPSSSESLVGQWEGGGRCDTLLSGF